MWHVMSLVPRGKRTGCVCEEIFVRNLTAFHTCVLNSGRPTFSGPSFVPGRRPGLGEDTDCSLKLRDDQAPDCQKVERKRERSEGGQTTPKRPSATHFFKAVCLRDFTVCMAKQLTDFARWRRTQAPRKGRGKRHALGSERNHCKSADG